MPKLPESSKLGATPGKLALIAVLALVLVVVLAVQFGGVFGAKPSGEGDAGPPCRASGPSGTACAATAQPSGKLNGGHDAPRPWPRLELADVSSYDPFSVPAAVAPTPEPPATTPEAKPDCAEQDRLLEQIQQQGVQAVVGGARSGNVAVIGSQIVRVGGRMGEFRVVRIDADGVVLERSASE